MGRLCIARSVSATFANAGCAPAWSSPASPWASPRWSPLCAINANLDKAGRDAVNPLSGLCDLVVTNGQTGVPRHCVADIENAHIPGVRAVVPMVYGRVLIPELDNRSVLVVGLQPPADLAANIGDGNDAEVPRVFEDTNLGIHLELNDHGAELIRQLHNGSPLAIAEFALSALASPELAKELAESPSTAKNFQLRLADQEQRVSLIGSLKPRKEAGTVERNVVYLNDRIAAKLIYPQRSDFVSRINLFLDEPKQPEAVRRRVQEIVGPAYHVQTSEQNYEAVRDITAGLEMGFAIGGVGALVVGLFLVYNALSVSVADAATTSAFCVRSARCAARSPRCSSARRRFSV